MKALCIIALFCGINLSVAKILGRDLMTRKNVGPEATPVENH